MMVKKRYLQVNEELFREHPEFLDPAAPSLEGKLAVVASVMPGLVAAAAEKAIAEWGRPAEDITHLVFATSSSAQLPHIDLRIASLLGLSTTVQRTVIGFHGCSGSSAALRVAKDIAENNRSARVLVACADMLSVMDGYLVPNVVAHRYGIIGHAIFGDGAGAVVVGSRPQEPVERPIFEMVSASQATLPGSELAVAAELTNFGMEYRLEFGELAAGVGDNMERCLIDALSPLGIGSVGWNNLFWAVHPGGPKVMDNFTAALMLEPGKLAASRQVFSEYGNMVGPTLIFVLDEVIRRRQQDHEEGSCEWGFMVGFGPGFTIDVMALHACSANSGRNGITAAGLRVCLASAQPTQPTAFGKMSTLTGEKMMVKKRYLQVNEELFSVHPEFLDPTAPSLQGKLAVVAGAMPGLVAAAAEKAIADWGRPAGDITHLVFATSTSAQLPHIDLRIAALLGLSSTVQRTVIGFHACSGSSAALRVAKYIAENNHSARVLVACADMWSVMDSYVVPNVDHRYGIIGHAFIGDGAGAVVVGSRPQEPVERPIFEMVSASQATVPGSERAVAVELTNCGLEYRLEFGDVAAEVGGNIERCLLDALSPLDIGSVGWNNLFWVVHPGGPRIMDTFTAALKLEPEKLSASRRVLREYGNMTGPTLIFVLDEAIRRRQLDHEEGSCEWGLMVGLGPGFTIDVTRTSGAPSGALPRLKTEANV
ncbi:Bisdemethoxycurcumin synthase [Zea mays]|uniref:Bisdemethoxycurcumin synthase n=1 Tax=Zea mays TaxID=4577 RepID=A0A3L6F836_MAIZE|nr:Bisdemethoxycurcumin synthase [Zea mays]